MILTRHCHIHAGILNIAQLSKTLDDMHNPLRDNVEDSAVGRMQQTNEKLAWSAAHVLILRVGHCSSSSANDSPLPMLENVLGFRHSVVSAGKADLAKEVARPLVAATWLALLAAASMLLLCS